MKPLVVFVVMLAAVTAQRGVYKSAPGLPPLILMQKSEVNTDGSFHHSFETENGIRAAESGYLKKPGTPDVAQTVRGSYSYTAPDGTPILVTYTADENGFRALGDHLPVAPEIPALIAKALAYNAAFKANVVKARVDGRDSYHPKPRPFPLSPPARNSTASYPTTEMRILTTTTPASFASGREI